MADVRASSADFLIAGAGPVGAACALFLRERGVAAARIALVDARTQAAAAADDRLIAISHGSATLLSRLGAWNDPALRATAIHTIHVSHRGRFGRTVIDRDDYAVPALGHVVRHGELTDALDRALRRAGVAVRRPARMTGLAAEDDTLRIAFEDGTAATARHVVHAEGGLFDTQRRRAIHRDYAQSALTGFVTTDDAPGDALAATAFERFTDDGPIALLPAVEGDRRGYAVVWCGRPDDAAARAALPDEAFVDALHAAFGDRLGRFATTGPRRVYPLGLNAVDPPARTLGPRNAAFAIGNAAQTLHPVAGQGLNLGLRDAHDLAALLATDEPDAATLVARFVAARRVDRATTVNLTDAMPRVFASRRGPVPFARGVALALLDVAPRLRGVFARQMMNGRR